MDEINNKTINDKALLEQKRRLQKLERAQKKHDEGKYGTCIKCGDDIPLGRLKFMPWTARCVKCAQKSQHIISPPLNKYHRERYFGISNLICKRDSIY
ncbi:TraR/DksA family transcriptional regulator [Fodinibius sp. AD559]|uniref:TraR/DksA family transcriptional regulator n=1 Tax=Fodinibius sp. AD559 TaxID=3424179 RepID=UPI004046F442